MKKIIYGSIICLTLILCVTAVSFAGSDSASIGVSCSIPAVPGLNAPPFLDKNTEQAPGTQNTQQTSNELTNEPRKQTTTGIQQESKKEVLLADGRITSVVTQTIYSR